MDIKEMIQMMVEKVTSDKDLMEQFKKDPVRVVEKVLGIDLPDDMVEKIVDAVKAKITVDKLDDVAGAFKKLF